MGDPPKTPPKSTKIFEGLFLEISPQNIFQHVFLYFRKYSLRNYGVIWHQLFPQGICLENFSLKTLG